MFFFSKLIFIEFDCLIEKKIVVLKYKRVKIDISNRIVHGMGAIWGIKK